MSRGFYTLASGMLTQSRKINISSNNMANYNTAGYKREQAVTSDFGSMLISKFNQRGVNSSSEPLADAMSIAVMLENNTYHSQGNLEETGSQFDFALTGPGFFSIDYNGDTVYTRNGTFDVDDEGYLVLPGVGRVQGDYGEIYVGTDKFSVSTNGTIYVDGEEIDRIGVYDFEDYDVLRKADEGMFYSDVEPETLDYPSVLNGWVERSNVDLTEEVTNVMESQRALQSCSQAIKIYDLAQEKAVNRIGKL